MLRNDINIIMASIASDIVTIIRLVMESDVGTNSKTNTNTLVGSNLYKTLKTIARNDGDLVFDIMMNDYLQYVENGRRKGAKWPPIDPIVQWMKRKGIQPTNSNIFLIRRSIAEQGIKPRPILAKALELIDDKWNDKWADRLFEVIIVELEGYFK